MLSRALRLRGLQANMATASNQPGQFPKLITGQPECKRTAPGRDEDTWEKLRTGTESA